MTITVEHLGTLNEKQMNLLNGTLKRNNLTVEEALADTRLNRENMTEGWQFLQRVIDRFSDDVTSGQLALYNAWKKAFAEAGHPFPASDAHVFEADNKVKFSNLINRVVNVAKSNGITLPRTVQQEIDATAHAEGDEEPF